MADLNETRDEEWEEGEDVVESFDGVEADNVMIFSDFFGDLEPLEQALQRLRYNRHEVVLFQIMHVSCADFMY